MTWEVPTAETCPRCGKTLFKHSGRGRKKPFCINESCPEFVPEEKRSYRRKASGQSAEEKTTSGGSEKKTQTRKSAPAAKKTASRKTSTGKRKAAKA